MGIPYDEIEIGREAKLRRTITEKDIQVFADLTGDDNPLHMDDGFAAGTPYRKRVVHGMLCASFISTVIGTELPGTGALWVSQTLNFILPVRIGDELTVTAVVRQKSPAQRAIVLDITVTDKADRKVLTGRGVVKVYEQAIKEKTMAASEKKAAIVTGASRGIGAEIARHLARKGFKVIVNYLASGEKADEVVAGIIAEGGSAEPFMADVRNFTDVEKMVRHAKEKYGGVDVLVNNAAGKITTGDFDNLEWDAVSSQIDFHVKAVFNACKLVLPGMVENKRGRIINITSIAADNVPPPSQHAYVIAKSALNALTKTLAVEYGPKGINVNAVAPGMAETDLTADFPEKAKLLMKMQSPLRRLALPSDVAGAVSFLAGDDGAYLTGETIRVCGGIQML